MEKLKEGKGVKEVQEFKEVHSRLEGSVNSRKRKKNRKRKKKGKRREMRDCKIEMEKKKERFWADTFLRES